jgi:hypothetical protein
MKKRILSVLIALAFVFTAIPLTVSANSANTVLRGDVDGDGFVTINDVLEILLYLAGLEGEIITPAGINQRAYDAASSITGGSSIEITDALEVLMYLAGLPSVFDKPVVTKVVPRSFTITLPSGWVEEKDPYWSSYEAYNEATESSVSVEVMTLIELFEELEYYGLGFEVGDITGMELPQIAASLGLTTAQLRNQVYTALIELMFGDGLDFLDDFMDVSITNITVSGRSARRVFVSFDSDMLDSLIPCLDWELDCEHWNCDCFRCDCWDDFDWDDCTCWDDWEPCERCEEYINCEECWDDWCDDCRDYECDDCLDYDDFCERCEEYYDCEECWYEWCDDCWDYECDDCWPDCDCYNYDCDCFDCACWDDLCDCWNDWFDCDCWESGEECDDCYFFDGCDDCNGWEDWPDCDCFDCDCRFDCDCWDDLERCGDCYNCNITFPDIIVYIVLDNTGAFMIVGQGEGAEAVMQTFRFV